MLECLKVLKWAWDFFIYMGWFDFLFCFCFFAALYKCLDFFGWFNFSKKKDYFWQDQLYLKE